MRLACLAPRPCPTLPPVNRPVSPIRPGFAGLLLLAGLLLWLAASWPLPGFFTEAIPHTNLNPEPQVVRPIASGDHLQLLYHFWLGLDALSGHSPFFHNVYEFNLGDDSARRQPDLYYLPFSLVYAAIAPWAGHAAGWNAAGLASVLIGILFTGLLARRFSPSPSAVGLATLLAAAFPYRWIVLFTGSPTGFAMAFPPMLFFGLDRAIRDRSAAGGWLAGLALIFSYTTDLHVFYFSALAAPFFALLSFGLAAPAPRDWPRAARAVIPPLLPFALLAAAAVGISALMSRHLAASVMAGGRTLTEMASYSPPASGLVSSVNAGMANHAYFGIPLFILLALALPLWGWACRQHDSAARPPLAARIAGVAFVIAIAGVLLLALGIHGPFEGLPIRIIRRIVPRYTMIRQTVKIYCLLPALLAPLLALLFDGLLRLPRRPAGRRAALLVLVLAAGGCLRDFLAQTSPGFCRLPRASTAYAAVAGDEKANAGKPPRALALPLWPGDSHWTSLCEYNVMLSRVRLVNGYAPAVPAGYRETVFQAYESLNQGWATDEQLDGLLALGVRHLIFHANAYPEQVSPFPAAAALRMLVGHPRLALIADDGQVFAFRILPPHPVEHTPHANWNRGLHAAARHWSWTPALAIPNSQNVALLLRAPVAPAPGLRYLLKLGPDSAQPLLVPGEAGGSAALTQPVSGLPDWLQADLPGPTGAFAQAISGPVAIEHALLTAGDLPAPDADGSIRIPPALLFHGGHSSPGQDQVAFWQNTVAAGLVLYGPNLPFPPGIYDITVTYSAAGKESHAGTFRICELPLRNVLAEAPLDPAADRIVFPAVTLDEQPVRFELHYGGRMPLILRSIRLNPATVTLRPAS